MKTIRVVAAVIKAKNENGETVIFTIGNCETRECLFAILIPNKENSCKARIPR